MNTKDHYQGVTKTGFKFSVAKTLQDDYELIELLADDESPAGIVKVVLKVLGKEQTDKLKEHIRNDKGVVTTTEMSETIEEIFSKLGEEVKNS